MGEKSLAAVFVGFDSAWTDSKKAPGAICSARFAGDRFVDFRAPALVSFDEALQFIKSVKQLDLPTLVALDQPTIVPNQTGMRPVEKVVASLISWMGGGVQPANLGKEKMFCPDSPIWRFLEGLGAEENPEMARTAKSGLHLIEVFPALAMASLDNNFFGMRKGPRYNPGRRKTFRIEDWSAVVAAARVEACRFQFGALADWLSQLGTLTRPKKADQDRLDAAICLLIAIRWRLGGRNESIILGDLKNGYIVSAASERVRDRLVRDAITRGVAIDAPFRSFDA